MKLLIAVMLVACTRGEEEFRKEREAGEKANAALAAQHEKEMAPFRALEARYKAGAEAVFDKLGDATGPGIEKAKGRSIAPLLRSKVIPSGEKRTASHALWCMEHCETATWLAPDPNTAGTLVVADIEFELVGNYVVKQTNEKRGDAYDVIYHVRAVLVPERITVATWTRHGQILAGYSQYDQEMPISEKEYTADMAAVFDGRAPAADGEIGKPWSKY